VIEEMLGVYGADIVGASEEGQQPRAALRWGKHIYMVLRGSTNRDDFDVALATSACSSAPAASIVPLAAHCGVMARTAACLEDARAHLRHLEPGAHLVLTGHSLGGMVAQVLHAHLLAEGSDPHSIISIAFASPPPFSTPLPEDIAATLRTHSILCVAENDPIPAITVARCASLQRAWTSPLIQLALTFLGLRAATQAAIADRDTCRCETPLLSIGPATCRLYAPGEASVEELERHLDPDRMNPFCHLLHHYRNTLFQNETDTLFRP